MISKFERGESNLSVDKFLRLLNQINASHEDILFIQSQLPYTQWPIGGKLVKAKREKNLDILEEIIEKEEKNYDESLNQRHKHNIALINLSINQIRNEEYNKSDIKTLSSYLFEVDTWGYYELILLGNSLPYLNLEASISLGRIAMKKSSMYLKLINYRRDYVNLQMNLMFKLLEHRQLNPLSEIIDSITELINHEIFVTEKLRLKYLDGIYRFLSGDKEEGLEQIKNSIKTYDFLGYTDKVQNLQNDLATFNIFL